MDRGQAGYDGPGLPSLKNHCRGFEIILCAFSEEKYMIKSGLARCANTMPILTKRLTGVSEMADDHLPYFSSESITKPLMPLPPFHVCSPVNNRAIGAE
jgi:hypothetical protein